MRKFELDDIIDINCIYDILKIIFSCIDDINNCENELIKIISPNEYVSRDKLIDIISSILCSTLKLSILLGLEIDKEKL